MTTTKQILILAAGLLAAGCEQGTQPLAPAADPNRSAAALEQRPGAVYLSSNDARGNQILVFRRSADGGLSAADAVSTGGLGTSAGLGNQLSLVLTEDDRFLYVVNAGSDDVTALRLRGGVPEPIGVPVPSGGDLPISLTVHGDLLYVLNAGAGAGISGFRIAADGALSPIPGSTRSLDSADAGPAQIQFTPRGDFLVVTEKNANAILTFPVGADGRAGPPRTRPSAGNTPFGFSFDARGDLVISEAGGTGSGGSTASSYRVGRQGELTLVTGTVATTQLSACWIAIGQNGRDAYTANTGSGTVSRLGIGPGGSLELEQAVAGVTGAGSLPQDADLTPGGRFLYVRNAGGSVSGFHVRGDGTLDPIGSFGPIPTFASGIAAR